MRRSTILLRHYIYDIKNGARYGVIGFAPLSSRAYRVIEKTVHNQIHFAAADFFALLEH